MDWQRTNNLDPALLPFLTAANETFAERQLCQIISEVGPTIKAIVSNKLRVSLDPRDGSNENQDALEIVSEVDSVILEELRRLKSGTDIKPIADLRGYVAVVTYHACYQYLRRKYPERWRLKNKLRYLLTHRPTLTLWKNENGQLVCGLVNSLDIKRQHQKPKDHSRWSQRREDLQPSLLEDLVTDILESSDVPLPLDDLVNSVAEPFGIGQQTTQSENDPERIDRDPFQFVDGGIDVATAFEQRVHLKQLWQEICELPLRHRAAILLNLRDSKGCGVISLLPIARVATVRQIANMLEFSSEGFAQVWKELPWDDATIAQHLGVTRQQVINLRHSARARLARRLKSY